jgi:hypothetical protein
MHCNNTTRGQLLHGARYDSGWCLNEHKLSEEKQMINVREGQEYLGEIHPKGITPAVEQPTSATMPVTTVYTLFAHH